MIVTFKIPVPAFRTDYIGSFIYLQGKLKKILTPVGYIEPAQGNNTYYFYQSDYQGNIRAVTNQEGKIIERNDYYPFGMLFGTSVGPDNKQPYKFGGKEYVTAKGYNLYNFGARNLNSSTGGWDTPDPLCENYFPVSPYAYCLNNPIRNIDPDRRKIVVGNAIGRFLGYLGFNTYENKVQTQINQLKTISPQLKTSIESLEKSEKTIRINNVSIVDKNQGNKIKMDPENKSSSYIYYNLDNKKTNVGEIREPIIGLAHELGHAEDIMNGEVILYDKTKAQNGDVNEKKKGNLNEQNAINKENIVREFLNHELRNYEYYK